MPSNYHSSTVLRSRNVHRGHAILAGVWLVCCVGLGLGMIAASRRAISQGGVRNRARPVAAASLGSARVEYRPIESIRVGQRVVTPGTSRAEQCRTAVDPTTWKKVTLRMVRVWEDETRDVCDVQTLQPPDWIAENHVHVGSKVRLPLDVGELSEPDNPADVLAVDPCPPIGDGPGRVVLTTVSHLNNFLFELTVQDESGIIQEIGVTGWHKLFSESRGWVSTCEVDEGEVLRGREGPLTVVSLARDPGAHRVYNMTVEGEHVYYVSAVKLLVHNALDCDPEGHHIATNKNFIRGKQWSRKFKPIFDKAGVDMDADANIADLVGHKGPHPDSYHAEVLRRLQQATQGKTGDRYRAALLNQLNQMGQELQRPGSPLRKLLEGS